MIIHQRPTNDDDRLSRLRSSATLAEQEGYRLIPAETVQAIQTLLPQFEAAQQAIQAALFAQKEASMAASVVFAELESQVRYAWSLVAWQVRYQAVSTALYSFYGLPNSGALQAPTARNDWLAVAQRFVQGDSQAVAAGYTALGNRPLLEEVLATAQARAEASTRASLAQQLARQRLIAQRSEADRLYNEVYQCLNHALRNENAAIRRQIMRLYGISFGTVKERVKA